MYEYSFRVRYSECDRTGHLSLMGLLGLFQDGGYLHAHDRGLGIEHSAKTEQTWYLLTWNIYADKLPPLSAYCTLSTWFYESRGVFARKNILLRDEKGEVLAKGDTLWVHLYMSISNSQYNFKYIQMPALCWVLGQAHIFHGSYTGRRLFTTSTT